MSFVVPADRRRIDEFFALLHLSASMRRAIARVLRGDSVLRATPAERGGNSLGRGFLLCFLIAFAALAVLGIVLGTVNFAAPAHAATYYYGKSSLGHDTNDGG